MRQLNQDLKSKEFHHIYLLYGEEEFLKNSYKKRLREALTGGDDMNFTLYSGKDIDFREFKDMAETMPFFAERRCILLEETGLFRSSADEWADFMVELPETTYLIFCEKDVDKRNRLYKAVLKLGYPCELARQTEEELTPWVVGYLKSEGKKITRDALNDLMAKCGTDMELLRCEMAKLIAYTGENEAIQYEDVETMCTERLENRIFDMIGAVAAGNPERALALYYDLLALREPSMRILFLIAKQFNQLMQLKELQASGSSVNACAESMKLKPFIVQKLMKQTKAFSRPALKRAVELCVEAEEAIKTGRMTDQIALELVIVELSRRVSA